MQTSVTFKNLDPSDPLKSYVQDKLDRFDRLLDNPAEASVVLSVEKFRHIAEININGDRLTINGKEETNQDCTLYRHRCRLGYPPPLYLQTKAT